ncbi:sigma-70 family RNA polymerase sigma factor [Sinomonas sp. P10A9]|uniref:Sigma-70 family RNA polymerase sigma factor n=1 Tax=Sinomonas puerhi TaxID=3238584 RepID=A0AB39L1W5_9MICC
MTATDALVGEAPETASDAELISQVRAGDTEAYGELFSRHRAAAVGLARRYARNASDAEDLAAEGFTNVFTAITGGSGPDVFFRAYLFTSISRLAARGNVKASRQTPSDEMEKYEGEQVYDDPVMVGFESDTVSTAFRTLPERWQAVLWYTEVDGLTPAAVAPLLGLSANGVSALALRAREGLRQAYLQAHVDASAVEDECAPFADKLGAHARGALSPRNEAKVREHLEECPRCTAALLQIQDVGYGMRGVVFPLVTGLAFVPVAASKAAVGGIFLGIAEWFRQVIEKIGIGNAVLAGAATVTVVAGGIAFGVLEAQTTSEQPPAAAVTPSLPAPSTPAPAVTAESAASPIPEEPAPESAPVDETPALAYDPPAAVPVAPPAGPAPVLVPLAAAPAPLVAVAPAAVPTTPAPTASPAPAPMGFPYVLSGSLAQTWSASRGQRTDTFAVSADLASGKQQTATVTLDITYPGTAQGTFTVTGNGWNCTTTGSTVHCAHQGVLKGGALPAVGVVWTTTQQSLSGVSATASLGTLAQPVTFGT